MNLWTRVTWFNLRIPAAARLALDAAGAAAIFALATAVLVCSTFGLVLSHRPEVNQVARTADELVLVFFVSFTLLGEIARRRGRGVAPASSSAAPGSRWSALVAQTARAASLAFPVSSILRLLPEHSPPATSGAGLAWLGFVSVLYPCWILGVRRRSARRAA